MNKITYLIGAGASANALPMVSDMAERLDYFMDQVIGGTKFIDEDFEFIEPFSIRDKLEEFRKSYQTDLRWLIEETKDHTSVDTFARKLYLQGNTVDYRKLKYLLNEFFIYEEITRGIDKRYDAFFAALLTKDLKDNFEFPELTILSWNYDKQIEFSLAQFFRQDTKQVREQVQIYPRIDRNGNQPDVGSTDISGFSCHKLNGTTGNLNYKGKINELNYIHDHHKNKLSEKNKRMIVRNSFYRYYNAQCYMREPNSVDESYRYDADINFSWEETWTGSHVRKHALEVIRDTETLVIIGYSFPTFNRSIDRKIFASMSKLKSIYLQVPEADILGVQQKIRALQEKPPENGIQARTDLKEFYIPFEIFDI